MYVKIPILRGFETIRKLFEIVSKSNLGYIGGGFPRWMCSPKNEPSEARDIDVFTTGKESFQKLVEMLTYQEKLKVKHESDISITYQTKNNDLWKDCPMINLIKPLKKNQLLTYGDNLEDILNNFDFSVCRVGILNETECLADLNFLEDERKGKLRILKMESPVACLVRLCKYAKKGYRIPATQILDVLEEWDKRGQDYKDKLYKALDNLRNNLGRMPREEYRYDYDSPLFLNTDGSVRLPTVSKEDLASFEESQRMEKESGKQDTEFLDEVTVDSIDLYQLIRNG